MLLIYLVLVVLWLVEPTTECGNIEIICEVGWADVFLIF